MTTQTTNIDDYMELIYKQMIAASDSPHHVILNEDIYVDNVLPKSSAGMWLKAGVYIDGVLQDD
jgi:hypothetical protein